MNIRHLIIHDNVTTPDGVAKVVGCETLQLGPDKWDYTKVKVKVYFAPTPLFPFGKDAKYDVAALQEIPTDE